MYKRQRDTKANVEEVDKTRIEDKRETKTKEDKKKQSSEYGRVRGVHMSRIRVELGFIRGRGLSSNHSGGDGGTPTGIRSEVKWMSGWEPNIGSKTRNAYMIQKVEGSRRNCQGSSYNYGRQTIKAGELGEQCNNLEGRRDSGNNTSKRSK